MKFKKNLTILSPILMPRELQVQENWVEGWAQF